MDDTKLNGKDLINIGIYTALYFVCAFVVAMLGLIPIFMVLLVVLIPLIAAIPFTMYLMKVRKRGMLLISCALVGFLVFMAGMGVYPFVLSIITGLGAEWIWARGGYGSRSAIAPTYACFNVWMWGNYLPYYLSRDAYIAARTSYGDAYWAALESFLPTWMLPVLLVVCVVCSFAGAMYAQRVLAKRLSAAGIE